MNTLSGKFSIEVAGKEYPCHLSMNAFRLLCEKENISFVEMEKYLNDKPLTAVPKVLYYGMLNHCYFGGTDIKKLPKFDFFSAHILDDAANLEKYVTLVGKAFAGEAEPAEGDEGNK
jgi:hypothetical protein